MATDDSAEQFWDNYWRVREERILAEQAERVRRQREAMQVRALQEAAEASAHEALSTRALRKLARIRELLGEGNDDLDA